MQTNKVFIPAKVKAKLDNMNLSDRFLFNETVEDPEIYNMIVEILMDEHISMLNRAETEKELRVSPQLREIRLDVIGMDEDGAKRIFINTHGTNPENFSQEFLDFMEYINQSTDYVAKKTTSDKIRQIHNRVSTIRALEKTGVKFMQWWEEKAYAREEGWAEGHEEGLAAGREEGEFALLVQQVCRKLVKGLSPEKIAEHLETDISQVSKICEIASSYAPDYDTERIMHDLLK